MQNVRVNQRRLFRRILRRHGYPPDNQEKAKRTLHEQAEIPRRVGGVTRDRLPRMLWDAAATPFNGAGY